MPPAEDWGFLAQQTVEKLIKALLVLHGQEPPRSHSLQRLLQELAACGDTPAVAPLLQELDDFAVLARYDAQPTPLPRVAPGQPALRGAVDPAGGPAGCPGTQPQHSQEPGDGLDGFTLKKGELIARLRAAGGPGTAETAPLMPGATPSPAPAASTSPELETVQVRLDRLEGLFLRIAKHLGVGSRDALLGVVGSGTDEP